MMKLFTILPLAALGTSFVTPDVEVMSRIAIEPQSRTSRPEAHSPRGDIEIIIDEAQSNFAKLAKKTKHVNHEAENTVSHFFETSKNALDHAVETVDGTVEKARESYHKTAFDAKSWVESNAVDAEAKLDDIEEGAASKLASLKELGGGGHHDKPNRTVYELISESKYTTKLAALVNEYEDLVKLLNGTAANYTIFAPIDSAFEKIPDHAPKPSKEELKKVLLYHVSSEFYPAGRILVTHTVPMLLAGDLIGGKPQRVSTNIGFRGLTVNFYSRIIAIDIFGTNGVIHGVDSLLIPPPKAAEAIQFFPGEFSTLELGLTKTGLLEALNDTSNHVGGTLFAPDNFAFLKLGPRVNAFLFSSYGLKYLKALLKYHIVANQTLYSDAFYKADSKSVDLEDIPKGFFHVDLPTALKDKSLSIDVARYGRLIRIKINGFSTVSVEDGIVADGVLQVVSNVLIPPKEVEGVLTQWEGEELDVEDFKARFEPYNEGSSFNEL